MLFQGPDSMCDGGRGNAEFGCGTGKALVAGSGLEEAEGLEWGQEKHVCQRLDNGGWQNSILPWHIRA